MHTSQLGSVKGIYLEVNKRGVWGGTPPQKVETPRVPAVKVATPSQTIEPNPFKPLLARKMSSSLFYSAPNAGRYAIEYDFLDEILDDWVPVQLQTPPPSRSPSPTSKVTTIIYDGMAGLYIAEDDEVFASEYAALANYILDNKEAVTFLKENEPIYNALIVFTTQMEKRWPCGVTLTSAMKAQLEIIGGST